MKEYWITNSRFRIILIVLVLIWIGFMLFLYLKADEITHDPCSICAKRTGDEIVCTTIGTKQMMRTYYPNYTISDREF